MPWKARGPAGHKGTTGGGGGRKHPPQHRRLLFRELGRTTRVRVAFTSVKQHFWKKPEIKKISWYRKIVMHFYFFIIIP